MGAQVDSKRRADMAVARVTRALHRVTRVTSRQAEISRILE